MPCSLSSVPSQASKASPSVKSSMGEQVKRQGAGQWRGLHEGQGMSLDPLAVPATNARWWKPYRRTQASSSCILSDSVINFAVLVHHLRSISTRSQSTQYCHRIDLFKNQLRSPTSRPGGRAQASSPCHGFVGFVTLNSN